MAEKDSIMALIPKSLHESLIQEVQQILELRKNGSTPTGQPDVDLIAFAKKQSAQAKSQIKK